MRTPGPDGLQASRTALSWRRTAATAGGVAGLVGHHVLTGEAPTAGDLLVLAASVTVALVLAVAAAARSGMLRTATTPASSALVRLCAGAVAVTALGALADVLLP